MRDPLTLLEFGVASVFLMTVAALQEMILRIFARPAKGRAT